MDALTKPANCPLTDEQWARLHPAVQRDTGIWFGSPEQAARELISICNKAALAKIADAAFSAGVESAA